MQFSKVLSKNQVTLPRDAVKALHLSKGDLLKCEVRDRKLIFTPVPLPEHGLDVLDEISRKWERLGITEEDVAKAIRWARIQASGRS